MEETYWLARKRASLKSAKTAKSSKARLIHFDMAGRYSLKANDAGALKLAAVDLAEPELCLSRAHPASDGDDGCDMAAKS